MTAAVLDRPTSHQDDPVAGDGMTLEELLNSALHDACTHGTTECPVCHARMTYTRASAECGGCGSRLT